MRNISKAKSGSTNGRGRKTVSAGRGSDGRRSVSKSGRGASSSAGRRSYRSSESADSEGAGVVRSAGRGAGTGAGRGRGTGAGSGTKSTRGGAARGTGASRGISRGAGSTRGAGTGAGRGRGTGAGSGTKSTRGGAAKGTGASRGTSRGTGTTRGTGASRGTSRGTGATRGAGAGRGRATGAGSGTRTTRGTGTTRGTDAGRGTAKRDFGRSNSAENTKRTFGFKGGDEGFSGGKPFSTKGISGGKVIERRGKVQSYVPDNEKEIRLNKFIANSGICSRREADNYIAAGLVTINGEVVTELGVKVKPDDDVRFNGERLKGEEKIYIVMNKPKDYVTTTSDPHAEKTVMDLLSNKCQSRVYPVGRLDKATTGVLLFTNDGEMAEKLTHPSFEKKKIYQVTLDKNLKGSDFNELLNGFNLEDGFVKADDLSYIDGDKSQLGIEIHSGRNRIIRRMFEHLGYRIKKLDRVYFAGMTKKNLRRGQWRFLTEQEVVMLRMGSYE